MATSMKLRRLLASEYGIKADDILPNMFGEGVLVKDFLRKIEQRGTEDTMIKNIKELNLPDKGHVMGYLGGVATRVMSM